jgi:fatty acid desaturase
METNFYRSVHFVHHRLIGTKHDTERSYFEGPTPRFLVEALTGLRLVRVMVQRNKNIERHYGAAQGSGFVRKNQLLFAVAVGLHVSLLGGLLYGGYVASALAWTLGMGIWFPFFAMFRQILEHRTPEASSAIDYSTTDPGATHRLFGNGPIASTLGAAGFNRHLLHHWDPSVSYTRLRDVEAWLEDTPLQADLAKSRTTYLRTFLLLYHR